MYCPFRYLNEGSLRKFFYFFQLNNPNVSVSLVANQLVGLTDVKTGKRLYPGDLKLLVDVIGVLSQRGLGTSKNESLDSSQAFVKVSKMVSQTFFQSFLRLNVGVDIAERLGGRVFVNYAFLV